MANTQQKTCAHPSCQCVVEGDKKHCSQRCKDAKDGVEISCDCGHPGCSLST